MAEHVPQLYLRLGSHAEKQYVVKTAHLFDGVIAGANLLESTPGATASLAVRFLKSGNFAIDPMTYTFGMDLTYIQSETVDRKTGAKKVGLKKSFAALAKAYGEPVSAIVLGKKRAVKPSDFTEAGIFAAAVLDYQMNRMRLHWESDPQLSEVADEFPNPSFTFAPYFYVPFERNKTSWQQWHELNILLAREFAGAQGSVPKHSVLCIDYSVLWARTELENIVRDYIETGCSACWLWFSNLNEQQIDVQQLKNLVSLLHEFREAEIHPYNMHGGFLSAVLSKHGMTGFSHGVGYGESKDVVPVIGVTVPTVNYHLPPIHVRVSMLELERAFSDLGIEDADDFHRKVCDCTVCKGVLRGNLANAHEFGDMVIKSGNIRESQTPDSAKKCRFHFLLARKKEIEKVGGTSLAEIKQLFHETLTEYEALPSYLAIGSKVQHLRTWSSGI
jgi:hypothetical protein